MKNITIIFVLVAVFCHPASASEIIVSGTASTIDGDTVRIGQTRIRLHGIDAPEIGQVCHSSSGDTWRCGEAARERLKTLTIAEVRCIGREHDRYGRLIAQCWSNDQNLNELLVAEGLAWAFVRYSDDFLAAERKARAERLGIWQSRTEPPWEYRASKWQAAEATSPGPCRIKGNISKNGRIYHVPWSPSYQRTKISPERGERWFCSEAEALEAGWRAPAGSRR